MRGAKLLSICALMSLPLAAGPVNIELTGAGDRTVVFASSGQDNLTMATRIGASLFQLDSALWTCLGAAPGGPRIFVIGETHAAAFVESSDVCKADGKALNIRLEPPAQVKLLVWLRNSSARRAALDEIANANWIFRRNLTGIEFSPEFPDVPHNGFAGLEPGNCGDPEDPEENSKSVRSRPAIFRLGVINYYPGFGESNTCDGDPADNHRQNVIFTPDPPVLGYLAHELGHALGLNIHDGDFGRNYNNGHTPPEPEPKDSPQASAIRATFDPVNTMWPHSMILDDHFTLGQVVWLNFSGGSNLGIARREFRNDPAAAFACPKGCPYFRLDDPSLPRLRPSANVGAPNQACPRNQQTLLGSLSNIFHSILPANEVDVKFKLLQAVDDLPKYCSQTDLAENVASRFDLVCKPGNSGCWSAEKHLPTDDARRQYVAFWKRNIVVEGVLQVMLDKAAVAYQKYPSGKICMDDKKCRKDLDAHRSKLQAEDLSKLNGEQVLWLDNPDPSDRSNNRNQAEQEVLRALGIGIENVHDVPSALARLRARATFLSRLRHRNYRVVITRFAHLEDLAAERGKFRVPIIIYSTGVTEERAAAARQHGACQETEDPFDLLRAVLSPCRQP